MRFLPVNLDSLLVELDDLPQTLALRACLTTRPLGGVREWALGTLTRVRRSRHSHHPPQRSIFHLEMMQQGHHDVPQNQ